MANPEVFVDTSGLYALVEKNDSHHTKARKAVENLLSAGRKLVLTDYIVDETTTLAKARSGKRVAVRVLDLLERSAGIRIEWIGSSRFEETKTMFRKHADHGYSFTDCTSFVVMNELGLTEALTIDRHFREAGFEALLANR
ncbi:MAG: type II toxin-antitoxin system VapC family toxin [Woeseiaceae bacterium]